MAVLREVPFGLYYGSVDTTPLYVILAGAYVDRTGDLELLKAIWPNILAASHVDRYATATPMATASSSTTAIPRLASSIRAGRIRMIRYSTLMEAWRLVQSPLCEVQAYVYLAKRRAATMARLLDLPDTALTLDVQAEQLRERFEAAFWCEEISTYALALDGTKKPCRVRTSNAGYALFAGIAAPERAQLVAAGLLDRDFFAGWGIRTVGAGRGPLQSDVLSQWVRVAA
jgi:glycogen debranching enzyme